MTEKAALVEIDLDRLAPEAVPGVRILPVLHDRLDLAPVVQGVLQRLDPTAVAVELPTTLAETARRAASRLPRISVVLSYEDGEDALLWAVTPGDPLAEALRWAAENRRPSHFIDPDIPYLDRWSDPLPDPYAAWELGPESYLELLTAETGGGGSSETDRRREAGMAYHIQQARRRQAEGTLLVLVGAAHARRLATALQRSAPAPFARTRRSSVELRHLHPESLTGLLPDPPLGHAAYEMHRRASSDPPLAGVPSLDSTLNRPISVVSQGLRLITGTDEDSDEARQRRLALYAAHEACRLLRRDLPVVDRWRLGQVAWEIGSRSYTEQTREAVAAWQRRIFFEFARRYARAQGLLAPGLYEWVVAARGVGDDNLAWEIFETLRTYPWQKELAEIATVRIDGDEIDLGTRKVRFRRRFFRVKQRPMRVPLSERPKANDPLEWLAGFDDDNLCSYPPEDLVVEDYGRYLQQKALGLLAAERDRVEPFSTGLLDGIDLRETLRARLASEAAGPWSIRVRQRGRAPAEAGSVVAIFDPDLDDTRYPFLMTWLGEHDQESDMAFYSTDPGDQIVGPGITRATYGGFLMTYPPGRLFEVWADADYRAARSKAEVLIMAAVDYSLEPIVVHLAQRPPAEPLQRYAAERGKRLVHIPLGSLTQPVLRRVRVVHLLAGHGKRKIARDYIGQ